MAIRSLRAASEMTAAILAAFGLVAFLAALALLAALPGTASAACPPEGCPDPEPPVNTPPTLSGFATTITVNEGLMAMNSGTYDDIDGDEVTITVAPRASTSARPARAAVP